MSKETIMQTYNRGYADGFMSGVTRAIEKTCWRCERGDVVWVSDGDGCRYHGSGAEDDMDICEAGDL